MSDKKEPSESDAVAVILVCYLLAWVCFSIGVGCTWGSGPGWFTSGAFTIPIIVTQILEARERRRIKQEWAQKEEEENG
jgi:uncharacterized membrane protein YhdT